MHLCRFTSGVKCILKLYLGKSIVTDVRAGERGAGGAKYPGQVVQSTRGPSCFERLVTGFEGPRSYKTFFFRARHTRRNVGEITSSL